MLREIREQPEALQRLLDSELELTANLGAAARNRGISMLFTPIHRHSALWPDGQDSDAIQGFAKFYPPSELGTNPAAMAEALPARVRCTGVSVAYNLCLGLLGGMTPMVAMYLIERTEDDLAPAYFLMAAAAITAVAVLGLKETCPRRQG